MTVPPGIRLAATFYYYQPYLPTWLTIAFFWWVFQTAYRQSTRQISRSQVVRGWMLFTAGLAVGISLAGPIPYYVFLLIWIFQGLSQTQKPLRRLNQAMAVCMALSFAYHIHQDLSEPGKRYFGRILDTGDRPQQLKALLDSGKVNLDQVRDWSLHESGRLRANALTLLEELERTKPSPPTPTSRPAPGPP